MESIEIIAMLEHYYEIDLDNCAMTHKAWIEELSKALTDTNYLNELILNYNEYLKEINT